MRRHLLKAAVCAAALAFAVPALADTVAITNARILTMGPQGDIANGAVVIKDGKIEAVGSKVAIPSGARVIDAHGGVVAPGFIAADTGLASTEVGRDADSDSGISKDMAGPGDGTRDLQTESKALTASFDVQYALNPASTMLPLARLAGITRAVVAPEYAGRRGQHSEALFAGQAAAINLGAGGDLLVKPKVAMVLSMGEDGAEHAGGSRNASVILLKQTLEDVRHYMKDKAAYDRNQSRPYDLSRGDLEALIPVVEGKMPVLVSVNRASDIRLALQIAREERLKIVIDGAAEGWLVAGELAKAGVPVIINPRADLPEAFESLASTMDNAAKLQAAGVTVIISGGGENYRVRELRYAAGDAVAYGLSHDAAMKAVTINPAKAFGLADKAGSLEAGKDADVVVWSGDPFEPMSQPQAIFIRGEAQPLTSRSLELRDRYMDLNRPYPPAYH